MAASLFAKRTKPGQQQQRRRGRDCSEDDDEAGGLTAVMEASKQQQQRQLGGGSGAIAAAAAAAAAAKRKLLSLDEEELTEGFKLKKSKHSRNMTKAIRSGSGLVAATSRKPSFRLEATGSPTIADDDDDDVIAIEAGDEKEPAPAPAPAPVKKRLGGEESADSDGGSDEMHKMAEQARLARAKRAAARELQAGGSSRNGEVAKKADYVPMSAVTTTTASASIGLERSSPFEASSVVVASSSTSTIIASRLPHEEAEIAEDEWTAQQMKVGAHRRHGGSAMDVADDRQSSFRPVPASQRDGPARREGVRLGTGGVTGGLSEGAVASDRVPTKQATILPPSEAMANLWERVTDMESSERDREARGKDLKASSDNASEQLETVKKQARKLERRLKVAQDLDEHAWSLAGLLDAKASKLKQATETLGQMEREFTERLTKRRRFHLIEELQASGATISRPREEDSEKASMKPRDPDRRSRQKTPGYDSSSASEDDAEELAVDRAAFCAAAHKQIEADVGEDFVLTKQLLKPLKAAKTDLEKGDYNQAYLPQSLPEALSLHVGQSLLWWDPLETCQSKGHSSSSSSSTRWGPRRSSTTSQLDDFEWFADLSSYTELDGDDDVDADLVPQLIQKYVIPEIARRARDCWDVTSSRQSSAMAKLIDECLLFESDTGESSAFGSLVNDIFERLGRGLEDLAPEVFVAASNMSRWYASEGRWRLLWRCCKIAKCAMKLQGRLPDAKLAPYVLTNIFHTRIAPHLRALRLEQQEMDLVEQFIDLLPSAWLARGLPPTLQALCDQLGPRAPPNAGDTAKQAAKILRKLRCFDEAQALEQQQQLAGS